MRWKSGSSSAVSQSSCTTCRPAATSSATGWVRRSIVRSPRSDPAPGASASCVTGKACSPGRSCRSVTRLASVRASRSARIASTPPAIAPVIIDAHLHVDDIPSLGWKLAASDCVRRLDEAGIEKGVVMTIVDAPEVNPGALELVAEACAAFPGRLEAFARIHPWYGDESVALLERAISELGFKGLKLHPVTTIAHPAGEDTLRLIRAAAAHRAATLVLGHMGGYFHVDEAIEAAERHGNLVLETSAMPYPAKIREAVERRGAERVLYASDGPACSPRIEVEKVRLAGLDPEAERKVLGE